jgi:CBS domain containing-hemolysin-like protein
MLPLVLLILILLCCSAFFSSSETTLFSLSKVDIYRFKESKDKSSRMVVSALKRPRETLVTILLGNEFVNICISIVGASIIDRLFLASVERELLIAVVMVTPIVLVFGEIVPKNFALKWALHIVKIWIWPLRVFYWFVSPLRVMLTKIADGMVRLIGGSSGGNDAMIMEEEYRKLVDLGSKAGAIDAEERDLIHNVFEFSDKVASDIMTRAENVFTLPVNVPFEEMVLGMRENQFSRVPFFEWDTSNIVGVFHIRDLMPLHRKVLSGAQFDIRDYLLPPLFVRPETPLEDVLKDFQRTQIHMALVRDDDGKFLGLVTMGDVMAELFGDIDMKE